MTKQPLLLYYVSKKRGYLLISENGFVQCSQIFSEVLYTGYKMSVRQTKALFI